MIAKGSKTPEIHDEDTLKTLVKEVARETQENPAAKNFHRLGTVQLIASMSENGVYNGRNGQIAQMDLIGKFDAETWVANYVTKDTGCFGCTLICGKLSEIKQGPNKGLIADGPEYESFWSLGTNCGMNEFDGTFMANILCDEYGMDTISAGVTVGFAIECYEKGLLDQWKNEIPELKWGDEESILRLIEIMANRDGFGDVLAEGTRTCAEKVGQNSMNFALQVKGLEFPAYDPRAVWGMALTYATSPRGACHLKSWTIGAEVLTGEYDRFSTEGKAGLVIGLQNFRSVLDSAIVCVIGSRAVPEDMIVALLTAITGDGNWNIGEIGERICNTERYVATQHGVSRKDDTMPYRILEEPLPNGPAAGKIIGKENFEKMLSEYYELREWDQNGIPTQEKLRNLQII
jgi:aldehyde:ferredoxin oxidoreductase